MHEGHSFMRRVALISLTLLSLTLACDTSNTNPGGHTPEEAAKAKPVPVGPVSHPAAPVSTGRSVNGAELFNEYCAVCHKDGKNGAPPLVGVMKKRELPSGTPANDARLKDTIKMGRANMPGMANVLSDQQVDAIVAYVKTL
jgi:mono/diheme cytochrome c family protein